jgi:hypothetical protein
MHAPYLPLVSRQRSVDVLHQRMDPADDFEMTRDWRMLVNGVLICQPLTTLPTYNTASGEHGSTHKAVHVFSQIIVHLAVGVAPVRQFILRWG